MTLEIALVSLIASLDIESSSDTAALEAIGEISAQVFFLVLASLILSTLQVLQPPKLATRSSLFLDIPKKLSLHLPEKHLFRKSLFYP